MSPSDVLCLGGGGGVMWQNIQAECAEINLQDKEDRIVWLLSSKGHFSVSSFYRALKMQNFSFPHKFLRKVKLPLKIKIFLWLVIRKSILSKDNLIKRGRKGDNKCLFCGMGESIDRVFF